MRKQKVIIPKDEEMNNTVLRLFLTESEMLRVDFNKMIGSNSISATKNCKRHISNIRKLLKEMSKICSYRKSAIEDMVWGGKPPTRKNKTDSSPLLL